MLKVYSGINYTEEATGIQAKFFLPKEFFQCLQKLPEDVIATEIKQYASLLAGKPSYMVEEYRGFIKLAKKSMYASQFLSNFVDAQQESQISGLTKITTLKNIQIFLIQNQSNLQSKFWFQISPGYGAVAFRKVLLLGCAQINCLAI